MCRMHACKGKSMLKPATCFGCFVWTETLWVAQTQQEGCSGSSGDVSSRPHIQAAQVQEGSRLCPWVGLQQGQRCRLSHRCLAH